MPFICLDGQAGVWVPKYQVTVEPTADDIGPLTYGGRRTCSLVASWMAIWALVVRLNRTAFTPPRCPCLLPGPPIVTLASSGSSPILSGAAAPDPQFSTQQVNVEKRRNTKNGSGHVHFQEPVTCKYELVVIEYRSIRSAWAAAVAAEDAEVALNGRILRHAAATTRTCG